jgi:sugar O-acyltransferase (sialic acid O-acetyltransferase NeuD family)
MKKILLLGAGGHCKACIDVIEQTGEYEIVGLVDRPDVLGERVLGYPVIGEDAQLRSLRELAEYALVTVGQLSNSELRQRLFAWAKQAGFELPVILSPQAYVSRHASIAQGTIVMHHALVNAGAQIGANCIINSKALVEHDAQIGAHCHISTGALINGGVQVGKGVFWGSGAVAKQSAQVADNAFIRAGSIVK